MFELENSAMTNHVSICIHSWDHGDTFNVPKQAEQQLFHDIFLHGAWLKVFIVLVS